jgi:hypothetical protein
LDGGIEEVAVEVLLFDHAGDVAEMALVAALSVEFQFVEDVKSGSCMEPNAGEFFFNFLGRGFGVAEADSHAFQFPDLTYGRGEKIVFLRQRHRFPDRGLDWSWHG